jgi:hypothetical protein
MDFTKFVSLLERNALFFSRADLLGDPFEGSSPRRHAEMRPIWEDEQGVPRGTFDDLADVRRLAPRHTFINAWHSNEVESAAMWNLYLRGDEGIAVRTTFERLCDSFRDDDRLVHVGEVRYVDYDTATIPEGNIFWPFVHKRKSFAHEQEVRAVIEAFEYYERLRARLTPELRARALAAAGIDDAPDLDLDEVLPLPPAGFYVAANLSVLIESVYIAPTASPWFAELVTAVMTRYGRSEPVHQSSLAADPLY